MLKRFYPYNYEKSPFAIDYRKLYEIGYRGILFDVDGTLVHHGDGPTKQTDRLLSGLVDMGFRVCILSNNSAERLGSFLAGVGLPYLSEAGKPDPRCYRKAAEMIGVALDRTVFIGDQIFTDIYGANRCGMASILTEYIKAENETEIGKKRRLERVVLRFYRKNKKAYQRLGNITRTECV